MRVQRAKISIALSITLAQTAKKKKKERKNHDYLQIHTGLLYEWNQYRLARNKPVYLGHKGKKKNALACEVVCGSLRMESRIFCFI